MRWFCISLVAGTWLACTMPVELPGPQGPEGPPGPQGPVGTAELPVGTILMVAGPTVPAGFLRCDGRAVSRTAYPALFAELGTTYGAGDGSTTFHLPDLQGRVPVGAGQGAGLTARDAGETFGEEKHLLTVQELAPHDHSVLLQNAAAGPNAGWWGFNWAGAGVYGGQAPPTGPLAGAIQSFMAVSHTPAPGTQVPMNVQPPSLVLHCLIKH